MTDSTDPIEQQVGDADFLSPTRDQAQARVLRKQLQHLADGGVGPELKEMARDLLAGRVGLREALRVPAYSEALGERVRTFRTDWEAATDEEREALQRSAQDHLAAQRAEIDREDRETR